MCIDGHIKQPPPYFRKKKRHFYFAMGEDGCNFMESLGLPIYWQGSIVHSY